MAKLTAQIDRAREDATQAKAHVTRYCTLSLGSMGLLPDTFGMTGAHRNAVQLVERTFGELARRAEYVVEGIQASVADYQTVDDETSRVFGVLTSLMPDQGSLPPSYTRYGLTFPGVSFSDLEEPTGVLRDPGVGQKVPLWDFDPLSLDWFIPSSYVREFVKDVAGRDPFQDVALALSGDWMLFERAKFVWLQIGTFSQRLGKNLARAAYDLRDVWRGREAEAAERYVLALANATTDFAQFCRQLVAHYSNAETAAREFNEVASGFLADIVTNALLGVATRAGLAGPPPVRAVATAALYLIVVRIGQQVAMVADRYEKLETALDAAAAWVNASEFTGLNALGAERSLR
ncbi:hypothetical protein ACWGE0_03260 [Lentzea sp. NPDC054927]